MVILDNESTNNNIHVYHRRSNATSNTKMELQPQSSYLVLTFLYHIVTIKVVGVVSLLTILVVLKSRIIECFVNMGSQISIFPMCRSVKY